MISTGVGSGTRSTTTRFWNTVDALQNRRLASYLPGSRVFHADWPE
ncbi:hypothetical protein PITC_094940 [Penicillium italicum]|uniref:Uncharacterized protein n=1 Tax=Penicillium italicum TaxID=40296 RepID=A0A0A2KY68_PENIT|nr:hypothetical protein PITC_094940 [Penicillium italicum]